MAIFKPNKERMRAALERIRRDEKRWNYTPEMAEEA